MRRPRGDLPGFELGCFAAVEQPHSPKQQVGVALGAAVSRRSSRPQADAGDSRVAECHANPLPSTTSVQMHDPIPGFLNTTLYQ